MDLKVGRLREIIASTIGEDLKVEGFSIDKSLTWLKKTINKKSKIRIFIDCYNYPSRLEYRLGFQFLIAEIESEREKICRFAGIEFQTGFNLIFSEGYFHPKVKHLEHKYQSAFTHIVTDFKMVDDTIEDCRKVLKEEIIPQFPTFSILENFQQYVLNNYETIGDDTFTIPSIIAMKLKGDKELRMITDHFWNSLELDKKPKDHVLRVYIENVIAYSKA